MVTRSRRALSRALQLAISLALLVSACARSSDGPTPTVSEVQPSVVCTAQDVTVLTISGSDFSPVVLDGLTDQPRVELPAVSLIADDGTETEVPAASVSTTDTTGTGLRAELAQGAVGPTAAGDPEQTYDLRVVNPSGGEDTLADALTVVPPPSLTAVDPTSGAVDTVVAVTLSGTGFRDGMTVTLDATPAVDGAAVTVTSPTTATLTFDLTGVAPGVYGITVVNPEGCAATLEGAFTVYEPSVIGVVGIDPPFGCTCSTTTVTVSGDGGFVSTPRIQLRLSDGSGPTIDLERVAFVDSATLTAVVPAGLAVGLYDVAVLNPPSDGGVGELPMAFRVVPSPVPSIEEVVPGRGDPGAAGGTDVSIFGENFRDPVQVDLLDATLAVVGTVASVTPVSSTQIDTTLPTAGLADGAYLVRVTNLDEDTYSTWSAFIIGALGPSGNLTPFVEIPAMAEGRRMLAGVSARDDLGNTYLYAIGGDQGDGASPLATSEVTRQSKFGALGAWRDTTSLLAHGRAGAAAVVVPVFDPAGSPFVPVKSYIYVLGGKDETGAVRADVERAVVLRAADAPRNLSASVAATGTLAAGTWYYQVSAVLPATDPDNPGGETLVSDEAIITIGADRGVTLTWDPVTVNGQPAASYRVYRTDAADGASQTEHLVAEVSGTTYTDAGDAAGTLSPKLAGALGNWVTQPATLGTARWGLGAALVTDSTGARYLYAVGGKSDLGHAYVGTVEVVPVDADGQLGGFVATSATGLTPRAFFTLAVETPQNVGGFTGVARLLALGGAKANAGNTGSTASADFELADAADGGALAAWTPYAGAGGIGGRAGPMGAITGEKVFVVGGAGQVTDTTFTNISTSGRDVGFLSTGALDSPTQSAAETLPVARALGVAITGAGFIYIVGGSSTGADALATGVRTF
jgi:hypothetical protein